MIDTLIVSGCSFTEGENSWANHVARHYNIKNFVNLGAGASGNYYICNSIVDYIDEEMPNPDTTLVLAMWSGIGRKDLLVEGSYWYLLGDYPGKQKYKDRADSYYVFSGGRSNSWMDFKETRQLFEPLYLRADPFTMCKESLQQFSYLTHYLKARKYQYKFTSYVNYWLEDSASEMGNGDLSLTYFAKDMPSYKSIDFDNWFFVDNNKNSLYEYARDKGMLMNDNFHPTYQAQQLYAEEVVVSKIKGYF